MLSCGLPAGLNVTLEERPRYRRYPLRLEVQYKILHFGHVKISGTGRTVNISAHGVFFEVDRALPEKGTLTISIKWPILLGGAYHLNLVTRGRIVRRDGNRVAVKFAGHEFRTRGTKQKRAAASIS
jgi:hypothetical protein